MDHMLVDAKFNRHYELNQETLDYCKQHKTIALYGSVQFIQNLPEIQQQLEAQGNEVITSKPDRTNAKYQILGCDAFHSTLHLPKDPDIFLYVGDGIFHPRALVLAQKDQKDFKMVVRYDPMQDKMILMDKTDCEKIFRKYRAGLLKFVNEENIGVIITVKPGQQQFRISKVLREKFPNKNIYYFAENTLNYSHLEDFNFVKVWINTACPRIGFDDAATVPFDMINITDAFNAQEILSKDSVLTRI